MHFLHWSLIVVKSKQNIHQVVTRPATLQFTIAAVDEASQKDKSTWKNIEFCKWRCTTFNYDIYYKTCIKLILKSLWKADLNNIKKGTQDKQDESNQRGSELASDGLSSSQSFLWMKPAKWKELKWKYFELQNNEVGWDCEDALFRFKLIH